MSSSCGGPDKEAIRMQLNDKERKVVEENMGLVGQVIKDHVMGIGNIGIFSYDDLFQIGCIGLCKAAVNDDGRSKFSTYAYICIRNEIFLALEYATVRRKREIITDDAYVLQRDVLEDPFQMTGLSELDALLDELQEKTSGVTSKGIEAMKLHVQGYNYREIGEMMGGVPAKNVTAWVSRARSYLKKQTKLLRLKEDAI